MKEAQGAKIRARSVKILDNISPKSRKKKECRSSYTFS